MAGAWTEDETAALVNRRLVGRASECIVNGRREFPEPLTWASMRIILQRRFGETRDRVSEIFRMMRVRRKEGEGYRDFGERIRTAARYVVRECVDEGERRLMEEVREEMILGVFMNGLSKEVRRLVKGRPNLGTLTQVLQRLQEMGEEEGGGSKEVRRLQANVWEERDSEGSEESYTSAVSRRSEPRKSEEDPPRPEENRVARMWKREDRSEEKRKIWRSDEASGGGYSGLGRGSGGYEERRRTPWDFGMSSRAPHTPCNRCKQMGHWTRECTADLRRMTKEEGWQREQRQKLVERAGNSGCWECGDPGHYYNSCPEIKCDRCGEKGHMKRDCLTARTAARRGGSDRGRGRGMAPN